MAASNLVHGLAQHIGLVHVDTHHVPGACCDNPAPRPTPPPSPPPPPTTTILRLQSAPSCRDPDISSLNVVQSIWGSRPEAMHRNSQNCFRQPNTHKKWVLYTSAIVVLGFSKFLIRVILLIFLLLIFYRARMPTQVKQKAGLP